MPQLSKSASPTGANSLSLSQSKSNQSNLSAPSSGLSTAFKDKITGPSTSSKSSGYASSQSSEPQSGHSDLSALNATSSSSSMTSLTSSLSSSGILTPERVPSTSIAPLSRTNEPTSGSSINDEDDSSIVPDTSSSTYQSSTTTRPPSGSVRTPSQLPPPDFSILNPNRSSQPSNRGSSFGYEQFAAAQTDLEAALESSSTIYPSQPPRNTPTASPANAAAVKTSNKTASKSAISSKSSTKMVSKRTKTTVKPQQQREQIQQTFGRIGKHSIIKNRFEIFRVISYYRYIRPRYKHLRSSIKTCAPSPSEGQPQSENIKDEKQQQQQQPEPEGESRTPRTPPDEPRCVPEAETKTGEEGDFVDAERDRTMEESKGVEPRDPLHSSLEQCEIDRQTTSSELLQNSDSLKPQKRKYPVNGNDLLSALNSALPHDSAPPNHSSTEHNPAQLSPNPCKLDFVCLTLPFAVLSEYGFHLRSSDALSDAPKLGITVECTYCSAQTQMNEWNSQTKLSVKEVEKNFSDQHLRSLHHPDCMWNRTSAELRRSEPGRNIQWLWKSREVPQFGSEKLVDSTTNLLFFPLAATNMWSSLQEPMKSENAYLPEEPFERRTFKDWQHLYLKTYYKRNGIIVELRRERPADAGRPPPHARSAASRTAHNANLGTIREQEEAESAQGLGAAGGFGARSAGSGPSSTGANLRGLPATAIAIATATASRSRRSDFSFALEKTRRCKLHHFRSGYRYLVQSMAQSGMSPEHNLPPPPIIQNRSQASMQMKVP